MMSNGGAAAAAQHAIANAIKSFGVVVTVENRDFLSVIQKVERPLVVMSGKSLFSPSYKYVSVYKGLAFYTKSAGPLMLPSGAELVTSKSIRMPS